MNNSPRKKYLPIGIIELALFILTVVGAVMAVQSQILATKYRERRKALEAEVGEMRITDAGKFHVQLLKSKDPMQLRWRIYVPNTQDFATYVTGHDSDSSFSSGGGSTSEGEGIYTVHFNPSTTSNEVSIYSRWRIKGSSSSTLSNFRNATFHQQLTNNDLTAWQIVGKIGVEVFDADQFKWLLSAQSDFDPKTQKWQAAINLGIGSQAGYNKLLNGK